MNVFLVALVACCSISATTQTTTNRWWITTEIDRPSTASTGRTNLPSYMQFRLTHGYGGRIEVYHNGQWGTICDDGFGYREALVICRYLGYSGVIWYGNVGSYCPGRGQIWIDDLNCRYSYIYNCIFNGWGNHNCGHSEDVGVECGEFTSTTNKYGYTNWRTSPSTDPSLCFPSATTSTTPAGAGGRGTTTGVGFTIYGPHRTPIRLMDGHNFWDGRVEVYHNGHWGSICDDSFGYNEATVVCKMLGFPAARQVYNAGMFGQSSGSVWLDDLNCYGYESDISDCQSGGWGIHNCGHDEDVGIACHTDSSTDFVTAPTGVTSYTTKAGRYSSRYPYGVGTTYRTRYTTTGYYYTTTPGYLSAYDVGIEENCVTNSWNLRIYLPSFFRHFPGYLLDDIFLGQDDCTGTMQGYYLYFKHDLTQCGTQGSISSGTLTYYNDMIYGIHDPSHHFIIREYKFRFRVTCVTSNDKTVTEFLLQFGQQNPISSVPSYSQLQPTVTVSSYVINMQFYLDAKFRYEKYGHPVTSTIGEDAYVRVYSDVRSNEVKMRLLDCYTKPTLTSSDNMKFYLIRDGCSEDPNTRIISSNSHETKFVFKDFEYSTNHVGLFLFCHARFCRADDFSHRCDIHCHGNKRKLNNQEDNNNNKTQEAETHFEIVHNHHTIARRSVDQQNSSQKTALGISTLFVSMMARFINIINI